MPPETLSKSGVKQVRGAVVRADAIPALDIDAEVNGVADRNLARCDFRLMRVQPAERLASVENVSGQTRSEEHTSELQSLMRISYDVLCLKKNTHPQHKHASHMQANQ